MKQTCICLIIKILPTHVLPLPWPVRLQHEGVAAAGAEGLAALAKLMSSRQRVGRNGELRTTQKHCSALNHMAECMVSSRVSLSLAFADGVSKLVALFSREQPETRAAGAMALASVISEIPTNCM